MHKIRNVPQEIQDKSKNILYAFIITLGVIGFLLPIGIYWSRSLGSNCNPNYSRCVPSSRYDIDCGDIRHEVSVEGDDVYRLDRDDDGTACEGYRSDVIWQTLVFGIVGAWIGGWIGFVVSLIYEKYKMREIIE